MKTLCLYLAGVSASALISNVYAAPGFVTLPVSGFSNSAYTNCFNDGRTAADPKGNFGSYSLILAPTSSINNTCWVPRPATELSSPIAGYTLVGTRSVTIPTSTGAGGNIGTLVDYVWRNSTTNMCIIGTRVTLSSADHDLTVAGTQYFQINDIARGGFGGLTVSAGYTLFATTSFPVFRVGRSFTSVQHRALAYDTSVNKVQNGINYLDLPTKNSVVANITGENIPIGATTTASTTLATQDAAVNDNWVDFTLKASFINLTGVSAFNYIDAPCISNPTVQAGAIRLRQTAQENTTFKEIIMDGYAIGSP